jgi:hypothetical protein
MNLPLAQVQQHHYLKQVVDQVPCNLENSANIKTQIVIYTF